MQNKQNKQNNDVNLTKIQAERGFYILTNLAFIALNCILLSNAYGLLVGIGLSLVLGVIQKFLILRIYNLKRAISLAKMINAWAKTLKKDNENDNTN